MKWFFAYRYLVARKSRSVINIITALSVVSVAIPLAAMIILLSVFNGFEELIREMYESTDADIEIVQQNGSTPAEIFEIGETNRQKILDIEGVEAASFAIEHELLMRHDDAFMLIHTRGVDEHYPSVVASKELDDVKLQYGEIERAVIDNFTAYSLGVTMATGTQLQLQTLGRSDVGSILPLHGIRSTSVQIASVKQATEQESHYALVPLQTMQRLYNTERATTIAIRTDGSDIATLKERLAELAGEGAAIRTRDEKNALFYAIMRYEKWAIFFVALLVLLIASMSIIGSVIMLITEKQHERITLLSIGCDNAFIRHIFVCEGLLIAAIGGVIGTLLGIGAIALQHYFGIIKLPEGGFIIENYPVKLQFTDVAIAYLSFAAIALGASYIATRKMIKNRTLCNE